MAVYVGRHPAALEWARAHGLPADARIVTGDAAPVDLMGHEVWGVVPLGLACYAYQVHVIEFAGSPPRGREYSVADMEAAGACWATYRVTIACPVCGENVPMRVLDDGDVAHDCPQPPHHRAME